MHFSIADILRTHKKDIMNDWANEMKAELSDASKYLLLKDSLPDLLDEIAKALETRTEKIKSDVIRIAGLDGKQRATVPQYSVEDALREFVVLRKVILKYLEKKGQLPRIDRDIVFDTSVSAFSKAAAELTRIQLAREHEAKKLARQRLKEKSVLEERLSLALEVSQVGIWEYHVKRRELIWTKEEAHFFNLPEDQLILAGGLPFSKIHPEDKEKIIKNYREVFENNALFLLEYRIMLPNGRIRWMSSRGRGIRDERGNPLKIIGSDIDITYRKESENALKNAAERMTLITDIQPNLISLLDNKLRFKFANKAYERWFGVERQEVLGKRVPELIGESAWDDVKSYMDKALQGQYVSFEKKVNFINGAKFLKVALQPSLKDGEVDGIYVSVMDISEQMNALEALKTREEEFRTLSNAMPQITWIAHSNGDVYWYNNQWYDYTGLTPEQSLGRGWEKVHHPDFVEKVSKKFQDMVSKGLSWEDLFPLQSKTGEWRWFLSRAIPIRNETGLITKWFGTNTDVTDQKNLTDELHQEQSLLERFISTLSHDLRTPLTTAKMGGQLIQKQIDNPESVLKQTDRIIKSIDRADKMIEDLLDASRLKAGKLSVPVIEKLNLKEILRQTLDDLVIHHGDRFTLQCQDGVIIYSWPQGIVRVLENLCSNAVKYGSQNTKVEVSVVLKGQHFTLSVRNYGPPLERDFNLFDEFQRSKSAEKSGKKGWGIGLTIVKGISDALGGEIRTIRHDDGTTFEITLPQDSRDKLPTHPASSAVH